MQKHAAITIPACSHRAEICDLSVEGLHMSCIIFPDKLKVNIGATGEICVYAMSFFFGLVVPEGAICMMMGAFAFFTISFARHVY